MSYNNVDKLPNGKPIDPIEMLKEIEAYLTFRFLADDPRIPTKDILDMKRDIKECLRLNGVETDCKADIEG